MDLQNATLPGMTVSIEENIDSKKAELNIEHVIMHYLDPKNNSLKLSDYEIELNITARGFFCALIEKSLESANAYGVDIDGASPTLLACRDMLAACTAFVPRSQELAEALYKVMVKNKSISSGDLLAIAAHDSNGPLLAIFKTELNHEFERKYEIRPDGTVQVVLIPNDNVVPSERRPPQKCAFIRQTRANFDVQLADNQIGQKEAVAKFFYQDFLHCELLTSPAARTLNFCRAVERWRRDHEAYLPNQGIFSFTKALYEQLQSFPLYFKAFAESALLGSQNPALSSQSLADTLAAKVFQDILHPPRPESFEPDPDTAEKLRGTIRLTLNEDIQISGPTEKLLNMLEVITQQNGQLDLHLTTPWIKRDFQKPKS